MLTEQEIRDRVHYHPPTPEAIKRHEAIRAMATVALREIVANVPDGREQSVAITKLEEVMFWANAGIARNHAKLPEAT
jgi:hypothetical protein